VQRYRGEVVREFSVSQHPNFTYNFVSVYWGLIFPFNLSYSATVTFADSSCGERLTIGI
jgi:hypothetical protein